MTQSFLSNLDLLTQRSLSKHTSREEQPGGEDGKTLQYSHTRALSQDRPTADCLDWGFCSQLRYIRFLKPTWPSFTRIRLCAVPTAWIRKINTNLLRQLGGIRINKKKTSLHVKSKWKFCHSKGKDRLGRRQQRSRPSWILIYSKKRVCVCLCVTFSVSPPLHLPISAAHSASGKVTSQVREEVNWKASLNLPLPPQNRHHLEFPSPLLSSAKPESNKPNRDDTKTHETESVKTAPIFSPVSLFPITQHVWGATPFLLSTQKRRRKNESKREKGEVTGGEKKIPNFPTSTALTRTLSSGS